MQAEAFVNGKGYTTLEEAYEAAVSGDAITLNNDVELSQLVKIEKVRFNIED